MPTFEGSSDETGSANTKSRRIDLHVDYNLDEVSQRISLSQEEARSARPWAQEIDRGLRASIRGEGINNLTNDKNDGSLLHLVHRVQPFFYGAEVLLGILSAIAQDPMDEVLNVGGVAFQLLLSNINRLRDNSSRLSVFMGPQWDRAIAVSALTRTQKLVKDLHPDKE